MNVFLTQHLRKPKDLYQGDEEVKIIIRIYGSDKKRIISLLVLKFNIKIGFKIGKILTRKIQLVIGNLIVSLGISY
jgi:hypothetical protein